MKNYTLIGEKLGHSLSPQIHQRLFAVRNREAAYSLTEIPRDKTALEFPKLKQTGGFNITIPYKTEIIPFLDSLDRSAELYGAVNCVQIRDGKLTGFNTDCDGFLLSVHELGAKLSGDVLLVGCGGVGRMIAIAAALEGAALTVQVIEPDLPLAEKTAAEIRSHRPEAEINIVLADGAHKEHYDLLVNATPVGMFPKTDACPVSDELIARSDAVFDVIYNPLETQLIAKAKALGKPAENGLAMLVWQAVSAHRIWDGDEYTADEVRGIISEVEKLL